MKYVEYINQEIRKRIEDEKDLVVFGQNVHSGSCLGGLTRDIKQVNSGLNLNTQNSENALVGIGFGLLFNDVSSIYFMKQQDFLLLAVDQLVNTFNILRKNTIGASFTIIPIIVDSGYEGPQSSLNNFGDFCSLSRIDGFSLTNRIDVDHILSNHLLSPGVRIVGISQRLMKKEMIEVDAVHSDRESRFFQYSKGIDLTIVCFNFSIPYGIELQQRFSQRGVSSSLFSINSYLLDEFGVIYEDVKRTKQLIVLDDRVGQQFFTHSYNSLLRRVGRVFFKSQVN